MKQTQRPAQIEAILKAIDTDKGASLEAYIAGLEARQLEMTAPKVASPTDPIWSHQRTAKRVLRREERAARIRNNYQNVPQTQRTTGESK